MRMETYEVTVYTGKVLFANTFHDIYIKLVGTDGESPPTRLINSTGPLAFSTGAVSTFTLSIPESIGKLLQVRLNKRPIKDFPQDTWFPAKVEVKTPERETFNFPIYRWITDNEEHFFREGKGLLVFEDTHPLGEYRREMELKEREEDYQWNVYAKGIPHCMKAANTESLPLEVRFSFTKTAEFQFTAAQGLTALKLSGLGELTDKWTDMDSIYRVFTSKITDISAYVQKHWREDEFFAYQFLNALNPMLIQRCSVIPKNFPVTDSMVFLDGRKTLKEEVKNGNIYLCDYKMLDGVETNTVNGKKQYLMAPLVLFHKTPDDKLMPIAIQLKQTPGEDNPIFFPTDSEYDWLLAKTFVRSADFNFHELSVHLLRTHLLAEVFAVSLLRNVPMVHPLYKLLVPHTRYTMQINFMARNLLISETGSFTTYAACGGEGMFTIMRRSMESMTYTSLCMPDDIAERGMKNLPNYYYRDDGLKLWDIIHKFVDGILSYYYKSDADVEKDCELQKWISDIFVHGFLSNAKTGIPQCFTTVAALVKFVTMAMFTCSVQHAAVNSGQFDYGAWMPNTPISLQLPPPTTKGTTTEDTMLQTLPDVNVTVQGMAVLHLLSMQATDFVPLGQYPDEHFSEEIPRKLIKRFQGDLEIQSVTIKVSTFTLSIPESIGKLLQVRLNKRPVTNFPEDTWFPAKVEVKTPEGETFNFPIYRWITDNEEHFFREGKALLVDEDTHPFGEYRREMELKEREEDYQWNVYAKGLPHCMKAASIESLPMEVRFSFTKNTEFQFTAAQGLTALKLSGLGELTDKWTDLDSIYRVFTSKITDISAYVQKHWREDEFFAYQFLNALNPMLIRRCSVIPKNFPVTDRMVFLDGRKTLKEEVKNSNIYLCDYKMLDGVETNTINGKKQYLMAPLVLLHKTPDDKLKPIAIQLKQTPGEDNPIFFPTDSEYDWLLAKIFVRSADVNFHGLSVHLLRTHLLADVFAVSLLRNVPMVHPLYKLLVPHTRYTLQINFLARNGLFSEDGTFSKYGASGGKGMFTILKRSMESLTYSSLCIPDDIAERGMGSIPNYYYRDDGLQLWNIIHRFVDGILSYYYKSDADVEKDCELQKWILDIFVQGFLSNAKTGIPQCFTTVAALVKFVTMVIFTCSLQHAAVNSGQFDFGAWMPNAPISLQLPPPTTKETTTEDTMLQTLPDVNVTVQGMTLFHLLSMQSTDFVPLGQYPEEHFSEEIPRKLIKRFQGDLEIQSVTIKVRNEFLDLPYTYMHPTVVENSVAM